ncbi:phage portal protein family protein [Micromonospora carbonacea]|uniref:phage portal protein family protein n=1 Tax=Micromonospora carbonacea TaxID=47853 RepID=UPI00371F9F08
MVDDRQYGTLVNDVYETVPDLVYPASVEMYAQMRRDPQLSGAYGGYTLQLRRAQWQLDGTGCRPEVTGFVADCMGLNVAGDDSPSAFRRQGLSWSEHLRSALLCLVWGHYGFEVAAEIVDGRARLAALAERIPGTIAEIHADPKTGALLGIDQLVMRGDQSPQIPASRLVWYCHDREGASWQGTSLLRPAFAAWLIKREMLRVNAISNRRWGAGVPVAEALPGTVPSFAQMQEAQQMMSAARAGDQAGLVTPPGFTAKIIGLSGSVPDTLGFIKFLNQEMSRSVLMQHMDLGSTDSGSRALGSAFIDSWTLALESIGEAIADTATRQIAARIVDWNWGETEPVPRVVVSGVGSRREVTAESLQLLLTSGALSADPALEAWVRREYRLPERTQQAPPPTPASPPSATPPPSAVRPRSRARRRQSTGQLSLFNAADPEPDPAAVQEAWEQARADVLAEWPEQAQPMVDELAGQAEVAAEDSDLGALGTLAVSAAVVAALGVFLAGWASTLAAGAVAQVVAEAAAQGVTLNVPDGAGREQAEAAAHATAGILAAGYATGAGRAGLLHAGPSSDPRQVADAVRAHLDGLSTARRGWVADNVGALLTAAQNAGRLAALDAADPRPAGFRAVEELDSNTCRPCRDIDGTEFTTVVEAQAAYPVAGYHACEGGLRCRGYVFPIWR